MNCEKKGNGNMEFEKQLYNIMPSDILNIVNEYMQLPQNSCILCGYPIYMFCHFIIAHCHECEKSHTMPCHRSCKTIGNDYKFNFTKQIRSPFYFCIH
jgi:hypothetical protein